MKDLGQHPISGASSAILTYIELGLWLVAVTGALAFVAVKLRNWGPIPAMAQTDYAVYYQAAVASRIDPASLFHTERWPQLTGLDLPIVGPFPYTPTLVLLFWPLSSLPYAQSQQLWLLFNLLLLTATFLILWRGARERRVGLLGALLWLILPGNFDTLYLGNNSLILTLGITSGVWAYSQRSYWRQLGGGAAIGVAASLKYFPVGLLLMAIWDRRWRFGVGILVGFLVFIFVGLAIVGWGAYDEWARMLLYYGTEFAPPGGGVIENQSIFGFWQKLSYSGEFGLSLHELPLDVMAFRPLLAAPVARLSALLTAIGVGGVTLYALWRMKRRDDLAVTVAWTLVLLNMVMLSPISWKPYVAIIAPVYPALLLMRRHLPPGWRLLAPLGFIVVVAQRGYVFWLPLLPIFALTSAMLFAYLAWWAFSLRLAWSLRDGGAGPGA